MYTITPLVPLPGHTSSYASGVNKNGRAIGSSNDVQFNSRAVSWGALIPTNPSGPPTPYYGPNDLQAHLDDQAVTSAATGINDLGQAVGYWTPAPVDAARATSSRAFKLTHGSVTDLPSLPGDAQAKAWSINHAGEVAGQSIRIPSWHDSPTFAQNSSPVYWSAAADPTDLGHATEDTDGGTWWWGYRALRINSQSEIRGIAFDPGPLTERAFHWDAEGGLKVLFPLSGLGLWKLSAAFAVGMNDGGTIVGSSDGDDGLLHPTMWSPGQDPVRAEVAVARDLVGFPLGGTPRDRRRAAEPQQTVVQSLRAQGFRGRGGTILFRGGDS